MAENGNFENNKNGGQGNRSDKPGNNYYRNRNRRHYDGNRYQGNRNPREEREDQTSGEVRKNTEDNNQQNQGNQNRNQNQKQPYWKNQNRPRFERRIKAEETIEDIKKDCGRIESEITLEIKEIETLRLGL